MPLFFVKMILDGFMRKYVKFILGFVVIALIISSAYLYFEMTNRINESEAAGTPDSRFGVINVTNPNDPQTLNRLNDIRVGFVRINVSWEDVDDVNDRINFINNYLSPLNTNGQKVLIMMRTRNKLNCTLVKPGDCSNGYVSPFSSCSNELIYQDANKSFIRSGMMPNNLAVYRDFIKNFVNDVGDAIGNNFAYLQIDNEVSDVCANNGSIYWRSTINDYKNVLNSAYSGVQSSNYKDVVKVVPAGFSSGALEGLIAVPPNDMVVDQVKDVLDNGHYDVIDLHLYDSYNDVPTKIKWFIDNGYNKPLIATELSGPDINSVITDREERKSKELVKRFAIGLYGGLQRISLFSFIDLPGESAQRFKNQGLLNKETLSDTNNYPQPAYYTYKMLIDKISGFSSVEKISDGKYKFTVNGKPVFILWSDSGVATADLTNYRSSPLVTTVKITHIITEQTETDANAEINNNVAIGSIPIDETPVFVEEEAGSPPPPPPPPPQTGNPCLNN